MELVDCMQDKLCNGTKVCRFRTAEEKSRALESFIFATFDLAVLLYTDSLGYFGESTKPS